MPAIINPPRKSTHIDGIGAHGFWSYRGFTYNGQFHGIALYVEWKHVVWC